MIVYEDRVDSESLRGPPPPASPRSGSPGRISLPGTLAIGSGALLLVVFGGMALAIWSQGGAPWKAAVPALIGLGFLAVGARARWRAVRLWRRGVCGEGHVMHAWEEQRGTAEDRRVTYLVHYEYVVDDVLRTGRHATNSLWKEGPTWVIYDSTNPDDSMPWRGLGYS